MTAHRFTVSIDGQVLHGLAFASEHELEEFLASRVVPRADVAIAPAPAVSAEPRPRGRPSLTGRILPAISKVGRALGRAKTPTAAARLVQQEIARTADPESVPALKTILRTLADRSRGQKNARKLGN